MSAALEHLDWGRLCALCEVSAGQEPGHNPAPPRPPHMAVQVRRSAPALLLARREQGVEHCTKQLAERGGVEQRERPGVSCIKQVAGSGDTQHAGDGAGGVGDAQKRAWVQRGGRRRMQCV